MMRGNRFSYLVLTLLAIIFSAKLSAANCMIDSTTMDRGETKVFIICGASIPSNYIIEGLQEANITIEYEQYLEMCGVGKKDPGIYLILRAGGDAKTASIRILNAETREPVCKGLTITVPDRIYLPEADFSQCDYTPEQLCRGEAGRGLARLIELEFARATAFYREGAALFDHLDPDGRRIFGMMMTVYHRLLQKVRRVGPGVIDGRVRLTRCEKLRIAGRWLVLPPRRLELG